MIIDVTYANDLVLSAGSQVSAIGAEAHASNVQVTVLVGGVVGQVADLLTGADVENLGRPVAACSDVLAIVAETNTAHNTLMHEVVYEVDVQSAHDARVEDRVPIVALALQVRTKLCKIKVGELVANLFEFTLGVLEAILNVLRLLSRLMVRWRRRARYTR